MATQCAIAEFHTLFPAMQDTDSHAAVHVLIKFDTSYGFLHFETEEQRLLFSKVRWSFMA